MSTVRASFRFARLALFGALAPVALAACAVPTGDDGAAAQGESADSIYVKHTCSAVHPSSLVVIQSSNGQYWVVDNQSGYNRSFRTLDAANAYIAVLKADGAATACSYSLASNSAYVMEYFLDAYGNAPTKNLTGESCVSFDTNAAEVVYSSAYASNVVEARSVVLSWDNGFLVPGIAAGDELTQIQTHRFAAKCSSGRLGDYIEYWKAAPACTGLRCVTPVTTTALY